MQLILYKACFKQEIICVWKVIGS